MSDTFDHESDAYDCMMRELDYWEEAGIVAVGLSSHLPAQIQAFFVAAFQEGVKYMYFKNRKK